MKMSYKFEIINDELIEKLNDNDNATYSGEDHISEKMDRAIQLYEMGIIGTGDLLDITTKLRTKMGIVEYVNYMFSFEDRSLITKRELNTLVSWLEKRGIVDPNVYSGWILQLYVKDVVDKEFVKKEVMEFVNSK